VSAGVSGQGQRQTILGRDEDTTLRKKRVPQRHEPARGCIPHLRVHKHLNQDPEDQHSLPVLWWGITLPPIVRRCLC
jgi:hypothetical protein